VLNFSIQGEQAPAEEVRRAVMSVMDWGYRMRVRPSRELYFLARFLTRGEAIYYLLAGFIACAIAALCGHAEAISIFVLVVVTAVAVVTLVQNDQRNTAVLAKLDLLLQEARGVSWIDGKPGGDNRPEAGV
jgi:hypothetical protein